MHPHILIILEAAVIAFCAALMFIARARIVPSKQDAIPLWSFGMAIGAAAMLLMVLDRSPFITHDVAIALLLVSTGVTWCAARRFSGRKPLPLLALAGAAIWLIARRFPTFQHPGASMSLCWGLGSVYAFAMAAAIWPDGTEELPARPVMLMLLLLHAGLYGARAVFAATGLDGIYRQTLSDALLIEAQFRVISMAFLVVAMTKQRAENAIATSLESARQTVVARQRFLAHMSHEVRTPLNGILGMAQLLSRDTRLLPDQCQQVKAMEDAGRHLLTIVNDALDLAKIDAGRMDFVGRSFDLEEAADGCLALVRPVATDKRIALSLEFDPGLPPVVVGDQTRLQQILMNLLWNAMKFTPVDGAVTLRIAPAEMGLRFEVADTGPGIPVERQHLLFQDFTQLEPRSSEGSGLGLAISARLARQMEGTLTYHPGAAGIGSVFRLELPWAATSGKHEIASDPVVAASELDEVEEPAIDRLDLLVVDDVRANRRLLHAFLIAEGHRVTEVPSGAEALVLIARQTFDAVLLDLHMPEMDGFELTRRVRLNAPDVRIIAVSADAMPETVQACLAAGMDALVAKPVDRLLLLNTVGRTGTRRRCDSVAAAVADR